jgi:hypothetical protein
MFVTAIVLKSGTVFRETHVLNIPDMSKTFIVLNNGTDVRLKQL